MVAVVSFCSAFDFASGYAFGARSVGIFMMNYHCGVCRIFVLFCGSFVTKQLLVFQMVSYFVRDMVHHGFWHKSIQLVRDSKDGTCRCWARKFCHGVHFQVIDTLLHCLCIKL